MATGTATKQLLPFPHEDQADTESSAPSEEGAHKHLLCCRWTAVTIQVILDLVIPFLTPKFTPKYIPNSPMLLTFRSSHNYSKTSEEQSSTTQDTSMLEELHSIQRHRGRLLQHTDAGLQPRAQAFGEYTQVSLD